MNDFFHGQSPSPPAPWLGRNEGGGEEIAHRPGHFHEPCRDLGGAHGVPLPNGLLVVDEMTVDKQIDLTDARREL